MGLVGAYADSDIRADIKELLWKNVAYATRYGNCNLDTVLALPAHWLGAYLDAINTLLTEENSASEPHTG